MKRRQRGRAPTLDCQCARRHVPPAERRGGRPHEASAGGHRKPTRQTLARVRWTTDVTVLPVSPGFASKPNARFEPVRAGCAADSWQCFPVCRRALFRPGDAGGRPSLPERRSRGSRAFPSIRGARRLRGKRFDASAIVPRLVGRHGLNAIRYREYGSGLMAARYVALVVRHGNARRRGGTQRTGSWAIVLSALTGHTHDLRRITLPRVVAARNKKPAGRLALAGGRRHLGPSGAGVA